MAEEVSEPRHDLIETAVRFLENSKVQATSQQLKRSFLLKKGLTEQEISLAFERMKPMMEAPANPAQQSAIVVQSQFGWRQSLRDGVNILLVFGGCSYLIRYLWKKYIRCWLLGEDPLPSLEARLLDSNQSLINTILALQKNIITMQESLERWTEKRTDNDQLGQLSKEVISLKSILLSSRSFPQNPAVSSPSIPSWQLVSPPKQEEMLSPSPEPTNPSTLAGQLSPEPRAQSSETESAAWEGRDEAAVDEEEAAAAGQDGSSASEIEMLSGGGSTSGEEGSDSSSSDRQHLTAADNNPEATED